MEGSKQLGGRCSALASRAAGLRDVGSTGAASWGHSWLGKEGFWSLGWQDGWLLPPACGEAEGDAQDTVPKSLSSVFALSPPAEEEVWGQRFVLLRHLCEGSRGARGDRVFLSMACVCCTGGGVSVEVNKGTAEGCPLCHTALV